MAEITSGKARIGFRNTKEQTSMALQRLYTQIMEEFRSPSNQGRFSTMSIGTGLNVLRADQDGLWLGAETFANAPFSVDINGNVTLRSILAIDGVDTSDEVDAKISISKELIELAVSQTYATQATVAAIQIQADAVDIRVGRIGGTNLLKNSVGLKGTLREWQVFDEDGVLVDARNNATINGSEELRQNSESKSGFTLSNQFIVQNPETIVGELYTFYCRFQKDSTLNLSITGVADPIPVTVDSYVDDSYATFIYQVVITNSITEVKLENSSGYANITDIVFKKGEATGWSQAVGEVYGTGYSFDEEAMEIRKSNSPLVNRIDEEGMKIIDTSLGEIGSGDEVERMVVTESESRLNNLVAETDFTVQRYQNPSKAFRIIPVSTGAIFTIND